MKILNIAALTAAWIAAIGYGISNNWSAMFWAALAGGWVLTSIIADSSYQRLKKEFEEYKEWKGDKNEQQKQRKENNTQG